ncbi:MAG: SPOR domain-containing protein [Candidatus Omnitrophica bacterium]|nr:SPOR domain-containing protein [Candidatus Omnitrophota bacterium]
MMQKKAFKKLSEKEIQNRLYGEYSMIDFYKSEEARKKITTSDTKEERQKKETLKQELGLIRNEIEDTKKTFIKMDKEKRNLGKKIVALDVSLLNEKRLISLNNFSKLFNSFLVIFKGMMKFAIVFITVPILFFTISMISKHFLSNLKASSKSSRINLQKGFTIQVAEYERFPEANQLITYLKKRGFQANIFTAESKQGKPRYRIYVGLYQDNTSAYGLLERLRKEEKFSDAFIRQR